MRQRSNNMTNMRKILFLSYVTVFTAFLAMSACSDDATDPGNEDSVPGIYYLYGEKITNIGLDMSESDTTGISLIVKIQKVEKQQNIYQFYGLEGADVSEEGNHRVFPECTVPELCEVYGSLNGLDLIIEVTNEERSYYATGKIYQVYDPFMELEAKYQFQNMIITYKLEGDQDIDVER